MTPGDWLGRVLLGGLLLGGLVVGCQDASSPPPKAPRSIASSGATVSGPGSPSNAPAGIRLGPRAFGSAASLLAMSADGRFVATGLLFVGAQLELYDANRNLVGTWSPKLDELVAAIDVAADGKSALVSTAGPLASVTHLSLPALEVMDSLACGSAQRSCQARFLADGSFVAAANDGLIHVRHGARSVLRAATAPPYLHASPRKRFFAALWPDAIELRDGKNPDKVLAERKLNAQPPSAKAAVADDGAVLFADGDGAIVRQADGVEVPLGAGEPCALGGGRALICEHDGFRIVEIETKAVLARVPRASAKLSPDGATLFILTGLDVADSVVALPTDEVIAGTASFARGTPWSMAFSADGATLVASDRDGVMLWSTETGAFVRRVSLPDDEKYGDGVRGVFRGPSDIVVLGDLRWYLLRGDDLVPLRGADPQHARLPRAFPRKDGSVAVCFSGAAEYCQLSAILPADAATLPDPQWGMLALAPDLALQSEWSTASYGPGTPGGDSQPTEQWLTHASVFWANPAADGGLLVVFERDGDRTRFDKGRVLRATAKGLGPGCDLPPIDVAGSASTAVDPVTERIVIPLSAQAEGHASLLMVDVDRCDLQRIDVPGRVVSTEWSPDGKRIAVGLEDRSVLMLDALVNAPPER